jgi:invasion protein IalB
MPRLSTEMSERRISIAGAAVLCILVFSGGAVAQTLQPKPAPQPEKSVQAPARPAPAEPNWGVICPSEKGGLECRALVVMEAGQNARVSVVVRVPSDTKKPTMLLLLPLGVDLPTGASLQFGKGAAKRVQFQSCDTSGCLAEYAVSEAEIDAMLKGEGLTISVQNQSKQPLTIQVPVAGFPEAYAKIH